MPFDVACLRRPSSLNGLGHFLYKGGVDRTISPTHPAAPRRGFHQTRAASRHCRTCSSFLRDGPSSLKRARVKEHRRFEHTIGLVCRLPRAQEPNGPSPSLPTPGGVRARAAIGCSHPPIPAHAETCAFPKRTRSSFCPQPKILRLHFFHECNRNPTGPALCRRSLQLDFRHGARRGRYVVQTTFGVRIPLDPLTGPGP